uniref:Uncharacterized protein n=1 Tax=Panagrolaimus sp. PS1159 TaxID=55785 RepID=A0AC35GFC0_9BILA
MSASMMVKFFMLAFLLAFMCQAAFAQGCFTDEDCIAFCGGDISAICVPDPDYGNICDCVLAQKRAVM